MSTLLHVGLANLACALALALIAFLVGRYGRRPALTHSLWLLVFVKLVTPPFFPLTLEWLPPSPRVASAPAMMPPQVAQVGTNPDAALVAELQLLADGLLGPDAPPDSRQVLIQQLRPALVVGGPPVPAENAERTTEPAGAATPAWDWAAVLPWLGGVWLAGAAVWFAWAGLRLVRFQRLLRHALPAPPEVQAQARALAKQLGLARVPTLLLLPGPLPPLIWSGCGRAQLYFPAELLTRLSEEERGSLLTHELAHVHRRDHWVRWLEFVAAGLYWWCPLLWWARRHLQISEEQCCDAWVVDELPPRVYAAAILQTIDFLAEANPTLPALASGLGRLESLKRRLTRILQRSTPKRLSRVGRLGVLLVAALLLPLLPTLAEQQPKAEAIPEPKAVPETTQDARPEPAPNEPTQWELRPTEFHRTQAEIMWLAVSPDGRWLAAASGYSEERGQVTIWDIASRREVRTFTEPMGVLCVAFSPDGRQFAFAGWEGTIRVVEAGSWREMFNSPTGSATWLAFSPDGKTLAAATANNLVQLYDTTSGKLKSKLGGEHTSYRNVSFSPDGKLLAAGGGSFQEGGDCRLNIWDLESGKLVHVLKGHNEAVISHAFSPDGKHLISGGWQDKALKLWDVETGKEVRAFAGHTEGRNWVTFSPDGRLLVSGSFDNNAKIWDVASGNELATLKGHSARVRSIRFTPDGKLLATASTDGSVKFWDVASRRTLATLSPSEGHGEPTATLAAVMSPDGGLLAVATDTKLVLLRDVSTGRVRRVLKGHADAVTCLAFSPDSTILATAGPDKTIKLWDVTSGNELRTVQGHTNWIYALAMSADGRLLASGGYDRVIHIWDAKTGNLVATLKGHTASVRAATFTRDGKSLMSGGADREIKVWDLKTNAARATLTGHRGTVRALAVSPDGATLASASEDGSVRLWDLAKGTELHTLKGHQNEVWSLAFSPKGQTLASSSLDRAVRLWDPTNGHLRAVLQGHNDGVTAVLFTPDGHRLVTCGHDRAIKVWHALRVSQAPRKN